MPPRLVQLRLFEPTRPDPKPFPAPVGRQIAAFSGGKDSSAMILGLAERGETFECLFTPTGRELPDVEEHVQRMIERVGVQLHRPPAPTLETLIAELGALPNHRMRWCTRMIKIQPCIAWLLQNPGCTLLVGLRADEEQRLGLYGDYATYRYPLREWGWGVAQVWDYVRANNISIPKRTDCDICYGQRIGEWFALWEAHPERWRAGEQFEEATGHTFRSSTRDTWPAAMADLRAEFERGRRPRLEEEDEVQACRVCKL